MVLILFPPLSNSSSCQDVWQVFDDLEAIPRVRIILVIVASHAETTAACMEGTSSFRIEQFTITLNIQALDLDNCASLVY